MAKSFLRKSLIKKFLENLSLMAYNKHKKEPKLSAEWRNI